MIMKNLQSINTFAIVGATGLVGRECLSILAEHKVQIPKLRLLASERSAGEVLQVGEANFQVEVLDENSFDDVDVAFFAAPNDITRKYVPIAVGKGCFVIDDSNCFRMDPEVPLIVPQVNGEILRNFDGPLMATPNCSTTPLALALKPLLEAYGIKRVVASTYQSVSGAGKKANEELSRQCAGLLNGEPAEGEVFPHQIAFNLIPMIGPLLQNGYSDEEQKVSNELRKILEAPDLKVSATAVRVPTFCGHGISANVELESSFESADEIRELLENFPGLKVLDQPDSHIYPTNMQAIGSDDSFIGRIRRDPTVENGVSFFVISDNLRKGAALNVLECLSTLYGYRQMN